MTTTFTEKQHMGQFLILSTLGDFARIEVVIKSGLTLEDGTVLAVDATDADKGKEFDNAVPAVAAVAGILYGRVDASLADTKGVMLASNKGSNVVDGSLLNWKTGVDAAEQTAAIEAMKALGFVVENV
jgi:hypothetical protein